MVEAVESKRNRFLFLQNFKMADNTCRIVFTLMPDGFEHTVDFATSATVGAVKHDVAAELQLSEDTLRLDYNGALLAEGDTLEMLGFSAGTTQRLTLTVLSGNSGGDGGAGAGAGVDPGTNEEVGSGNMGAGEIEVVVHFDDPNEQKNGQSGR